MRIIFDVGANDGVFSVEDAKKGDTVWAFEPHPGFCDIIKSKIVELPNYNLVEKAVSDFNGRAAFNIFRSEDCSSLSTTADGFKEHWTNLEDRMTNILTIDVDVITLKKFIIQNKIPRIDWMYCDAQGHDLNVLKGLGEYWRILKSGMLETVREEKVRLYKGQYTLGEVISWLEEKGFLIDKILPNDWRESDGEMVSDGNELNVFFSNPNFESLY